MGSESSWLDSPFQPGDSWGQCGILIPFVRSVLSVSDTAAFHSILAFLNLDFNDKIVYWNQHLDVSSLRLHICTGIPSALVTLHMPHLHNYGRSEGYQHGWRDGCEDKHTACDVNSKGSLVGDTVQNVSLMRAKNPWRTIVSRLIRNCTFSRSIGLKMHYQCELVS